MSDLKGVRGFVTEMTRLVDEEPHDETVVVTRARALLAELVRRDDWLPEEFAQPHPEYYRQYLLHCDPLERFSLVSFVWGPGQATPVHDHTVWGLIGMLRGAEDSEAFEPAGDGQPMRSVGKTRLEPGQIEGVSPRTGDIHRVANAYVDRVSISIHLYGGNIGAVRRNVYDAGSGRRTPFVSGYANTRLPNLWDRSEEVRNGS